MGHTDSIILHRSLGSPYSQKVMTMLGYMGIDYYSVIAPKGVPRPIQEKLVGNYSRRIPILQIGADFYCDTALICSQLAHVSGQKELDMKHLPNESQEFIKKVENIYAKAMLGSLTPLDFVLGYFKNIPPLDAFAFLKDRVKLKKEFPDVNPIGDKTRQEWQQIGKNYLEFLNKKLDGHLFLFSENNTPSAIDFSVFSYVWYHQMLNNLKLAKDLSHLKAWLKRLNKFEKGNYSNLVPEKSVEIAKEASPIDIPKNMKESSQIGSLIQVPVNDVLGKTTKPIEGILKGKNEYKYIIERPIDNSNRVHIHIPKQCYGACG